MKVIAVTSSCKNSGKTSTVEALVKGLAAKGFSVGTIKQIHEDSFSIDTPQKDTWRHTEAGAKVVVTAAPKEVALIKRIKGERFAHAMELMSNEGLDVVIVEGNPPADMPRILASRTPRAAEDRMKELKGVFCVTSLSLESFYTDFPVPVLHPVKDIEKLLELTEARVFG